MKEFQAAGKLIAIICASVIAISEIDEFKSMKVTSHPSVKDEFAGWDYCEDGVVVSKNLITSRGPGTAFKFALKIVEMSCGKEVLEIIMKPMMCEA